MRAGAANTSLAIAVALLGTTASCGVAERPAATPGEGSGQQAAPPSPPPTSPPPTQEPASWADTVERVTSGVIDVAASFCEAQTTGAGFLVEDGLVLTAAHVVRVEGANPTLVSLKTDSGVTPGTVVGLSRTLDLALVRPAAPLEGHVFELAPAPPRVGEEIAALGFPVAGTPTFTTGHVSAHGRLIRHSEAEFDAMQIDAAVNPGNSGGPVILLDGSVAGVVSALEIDAENINYAVPVDTVSSQLSLWRRTEEPVEAPDCTGDAQSEPPDDTSSPGELLPETVVTADHPEADAVEHMLFQHGWNINHDNYLAAYQLFTPEIQQRIGGLEEWSAGLQTTVWRHVDVLDVSEDDTGRLTADVRLVTEQAPEDGLDGQTCSVFTLRYELVEDETHEDVWRIDRVALPGGPQEPCT